MWIIGLIGVAYCSFQIYEAFKGRGGIPFGAIFGGAVGGMGGAMAGSALAGDGQKKPKPKPKWGAIVFWGFVWLVWLGIFIGIAGE